MATRTRRLWGPTLLAAAAESVLFTCPAGRTCIVKTVTFTNTGAANQTVRLGIGGTAAGQRIWGVQTVNASGSFVLELWFVLNPGDQLVVLPNAGGVITCAGFGSLLLGAPS